ncbi:MAG: hypothetical protein JXR34_10780 [Bacteroidales bacterium]|nr:hypothetical protein [Bacteroidales bacterium]
MENPYEGRKWIREGLLFGVFIYVINFLFIPWAYKDEFSLKTLSIGAAVSLFGGLGFGITMKYFYNWLAKRKKKKEN